MRNLLNPWNWAASLFVHHIKVLHTCGIYPPNPQNTWLAASSNNAYGKVEDRLELPIVEGVHWGAHYPFSPVTDEALLIMWHLGQLPSTPLVHWQPLAEMTVPVIGKSDHQSQYWVAINHTIVLKCHSDPLCLAPLSTTIAGAIQKPPYSWMTL